MTDAKYWVWYSLAVGPGSKNDEIISAFPDPEKFFKSSLKEIMLSGATSAYKAQKMLDTPMEKAENIVRLCEKNGWSIVTPESKEYPRSLKRLTDMPLVLYVDGDPSYINSEVAIGVVGTRKPSGESIDLAKKLSAQAAAAGAVIVSGGALGIDSAAHEGALLANGKTVGVLGCGFGTNYLMENEPLRRQISKNGALVTEYAPLTGASRYTFPARNRIIAAFSQGVLVVEAGEYSGSLITARKASEQGKEVYAIPGSVLTTAYTGANKLIRDGAKAVSCAADMLMPYSVMYPDIIKLENIEKLPEELRIIGRPEPKVEEKQKEEKKPPKEKKPLPANIPPAAAAVYEFFGDSPLHPNEISAMSGMPLSQVVSALFKLEVEDLIEQTDGKNYQLK